MEEEEEMIWAIRNNERIRATPKDKATCPICNKEVIAKCGTIKIWHWSHLSKRDCDDWAEPDNEWHINWQNEFPKEWQEVKVGNHRADIKTRNGMIIEFQNSSLSVLQIYERENFYDNMVWVLNGEKFGDRLNIRFDGERKIYTFRWKNPPKSWWYAKKEIYVDQGNCLFQIKKIYPNLPCGGWGIIIQKKDFLNKYKPSTKWLT